MDDTFEAIVTGMEAALLRARGLPVPRIEPLFTWARDESSNITRTEYRAVIVVGERRIEALGQDPESATRRVIRMAVER